MRSIAVLLSTVCLFATHGQSIDLSFGVGGDVPYGGATGNSEQNRGRGYNSAVQPDGRVVVCMDMADPNTSDLFFYTYRYNDDGTPDASFGNNGVSRLFVGDQSRNHDLQLEPDGRITVVGQSEYCTNGICGAPQFIMMRLLPDGGLDSTFGNAGHLITTDVFGSVGTFALPYRVNRMADGRYITGGRGINGRPYVARHQANGFPDASFASAGVFTDMTQGGYFVDLVIDDAGNTFALMEGYNYVGGVLDSTDLSDTYIIKLDASGSPDPAFGMGGVMRFNMNARDLPTSIALADGGGLVVTGGEWIAFVSSTGTLMGSAMIAIPNEGEITVDMAFVVGPDRYTLCGKVQQEVSGNFLEKAFVAQVDAQGQFRNDFNATGYMVMDRGAIGSSGWQGKLCRLQDVDVLPDGTAYATGYRNPLPGNTKRSLFLVKLLNLPMSGATLGINPTAVLHAPLVHPNPVHDILNVTSSAAGRFEIVDMRGALVQQGRSVQGMNTLRLDTGLAAGVYGLRLFDQDGSLLHVQRVVKEEN